MHGLCAYDARECAGPTRHQRSAIAALAPQVYTRTINMIFARMEVPTLRLMSTVDDLPYLKQLYAQALSEFTELHQGVYLGFGKQRRLSESFGLRTLWGEHIWTSGASERACILVCCRT